MDFYHLSHTDMDGYGCQLITKKLFPNGTFYNANYGIEVKLFLQEILQQIENSPTQNEVLFMITDLNLTVDESKNLDKKITKLQQNGHTITLQLLDHHGTGKKSSETYEWYYLDTSRSATKITYEYCCEHYVEFYEKCEPNFPLLIQAINAADIWKEKDELFEFGKVCMSMITKSHEINHLLFPTQHREYKHYLLTKALDFIEQPYGHIALDENIYYLKKTFLNSTSTNNTLDNLISYYLVESLEGKKRSLLYITKSIKGYLLTA